MGARKTSAWSPAELHRHLEQGSRLAILDVRNPDEFETWQIQGRGRIKALNIPYYDLFDLREDNEDLAHGLARRAPKALKDWLPKSGPVLVVCARGDTSTHVAEGLQCLNYPAVNLEGGMAAWGNHYEVRAVEDSERLTLLQVSRPARGCLSYLLASGGEALVVDAARHTDVYIRIAAERGWRITAVMDTHLQADHLSGGVGLAKELGIHYWLHPYDSIDPDALLPARISFKYLENGTAFTLGEVGVRALHLPGHTLGMTNLLVDERYVLTGDTLFIDSIGRPDLGGRAKTWTPLLYRSLHRLLKLPDHTVVLPAHFNQMREADDKGCYRATLSALHRRNEGLRMLDRGRAAFGTYILASLPEHPPTYDVIRRVNTGLLHVDEVKASELELGRNRCALSRPETAEQRKAA
jgi:glyoxylase-like metal-dependent hydrolase (beta-lactamase superfamily II)/rhodanese-related sulfurtransferase